MKKLAFLIVLMLAALTAGAQTIDLKGRTVNGTLPQPSVKFNTSGKIVVEIWVDNYGNVQKASTQRYGTTITDRIALDAARKAALSTHFNMDTDSPAMQKGTITYHFEEEKDPILTPIQKSFFENIVLGEIINEKTFAACPILVPRKEPFEMPLLPFTGDVYSYTIAENFLYGGITWNSIMIISDSKDESLGIVFMCAPTDFENLFDAITNTLKKKYGKAHYDESESMIKLLGWEDEETGLLTLGISEPLQENTDGVIIMCYMSKDVGSVFTEKEQDFMSAF